MTSQLDAAKGREIVARWCKLAEQRLDYLTELYESGRWRRFHSEPDFLENFREAKAAVASWRDLLSSEATTDNRPIDLSWLGRPKTPLPEVGYRRAIVDLPKIENMPVVAPQEPLLVKEDTVGSEVDSLEAQLSEDAFTAVLDLATIAARYPLLRNAL
jgi:uncharacterized repeat protein (TIGR03809 family)